MATVKRFHYDNHDQLRRHFQDFIDAYNFGRRLKMLKGLTPYEFICKRWTSEPDRFNATPETPASGAADVMISEDIGRLAVVSAETGSLLEYSRGAICSKRAPIRSMKNATMPGFCRTFHGARLLWRREVEKMGKSRKIRAARLAFLARHVSMQRHYLVKGRSSLATAGVGFCRPVVIGPRHPSKPPRYCDRDPEPRRAV